MSTAHWDEICRKGVDWRRRLHRAPELTWQERATAARIRGELDRLGIAWRTCAETGTVATLANKAAGRHIALRADIDALPIVEASGVDWRSEHEGVMHACGHDGHTATLMTAAEWLVAHEAKLPGPVTLLFQPAEEGGHGAKAMIEDGALDGVDAVFGWHNWPNIPLGRAVCPDGVVMAANGTFVIELIGEGGHASQPERTRDPILAAAAVIQALQQVVSRRLPPQEPAVLSVASLQARSTDTIIPERAELSGTIRCGNTQRRDHMFELITTIAEQTAAGYGVRAQVTCSPRYGATCNDPTEADTLRRALAAELGDDWPSPETPLPIMASEDFSYYLAERPGAFALVGAGDGPPCHSSRYDFNDALLPLVARLFLRLAALPEGDLPPGVPTLKNHA